MRSRPEVVAAQVVLQSSDSVFHGTFSGINERDPEVWVVSRPHNWRPSTAEEKLLLVSTDVEELVKSTVVVPSRCCPARILMAGVRLRASCSRRCVLQGLPAGPAAAAEPTALTATLVHAGSHTTRSAA